MTDAAASQVAVYFPTLSDATNEVPQVAVYFAVREIALEIDVPQLAIYMAVREYEIPINLRGFLIRSIWGFPLFIEEAPHD